MKKKLIKFLSVLILFSLINEIIFPTCAYALTGGPSQPEVESFEPVSTTEMVDLFSGDFNYNIPLLDIDGYPINISYHSGINMDQEASWVGLGWNINPGVINRGMRGLPDDFNGDNIERFNKIKPNKTFGGKLGFHLELAGLKANGVTGKAAKKLKNVLKNLMKKYSSNSGLGAKLGMGIFYNNYKGMGFELNSDASFSSNKNLPLKISGGVGLNLNSQQGVGISPNLSMSATMESKNGDKLTTSIGVGSSMNSRTGLANLSYRTSASVATQRQTKKAADKHKMKDNDQFSQSLGNFSSPIISTESSYSPKGQLAYSNVSYSFEYTGGAEVPFTVNIGGSLSGYYSQQDIKTNSQNLNGYGYNFLENGDNSAYSLLDFNREKDGMFSKNTPALPLANLTYDVYSIAGQGIAGSYRPFRSDVGSIYDNTIKTEANSISVGVDAGFGNAFKVGADAVQNFSDSYSGKWDLNPASDQLKYTSKTENKTNQLYEPYYYKTIGEKTASNVQYINQFGGYNPAAVKLFQAGKKSEASMLPILSVMNVLDPSVPGEIPLINTQTKEPRVRRNQAIYSLSSSDATKYGLDKTITSYAVNQYPYQTNATTTTIDRADGATRKAHHISEVDVIKPSGERYIYGLPAYNKKQVEIDFNASNYQTNEGVVSYTGDIDDYNIAGGVDNYYSKNTTPAYAHSYLITGILSPDYIDRTGDGITDDDYGKAVKFNYTLANSNYKWRTPYEANKANSNDQLKSNPNDNRANIIYGEKEIWMLNSIVTKNYIAIFKISPRKDAKGVSNINGGIDVNNSTYQLDQIELYAKNDWIKNQNSQNPDVKPTPIKTVHFVYDYSLCQNIPNNQNTETGQKGKLTLKKIYFTYENNLRGKLNSYQFEYNNNNAQINKGYNQKAVDRWGNYKEKDNAFENNTDFPYATQDKTTADENAAAWSLSKIYLPSGGQINVQYESDDYAFVQDKTAMQMFKVVGFSYDASETSTANLSDKLYERTGNVSADNFEEKNYAVIDISEAQAQLDNPITNDADFKQRFLSGIKDLFFKMKIDIDGKNNYEYVAGYAEIDYADSHICSGNTNMAFIKLKPSNLKDDGKGPEVNPIAKAAWNFARMQTPYLIYPGSEPNTTGESAVKSFISYWNEILGMAIGPNRVIRKRGFGQKVSLNDSFIRLNSPNGHKCGGGCRVKQITMSDSWELMKGDAGSSYSYGQEYNYNLPDGSSSGVAAYEPLMGGEENPWRQPVAYSNDRKLAPDESFYQETPYGESFFPQASVGYSKVTVKNLQHENVNSNATGFVEHGFYTAKDFPTLTLMTPIQTKPAKPKTIWRVLKRIVKESLVMSQGFTVINNDMHGKAKYVYNYAQGQTSPFSKTTYYYSTKNGNRLSNKVKTINSSGIVEESVIGEEYDVVSDLREEQSYTNTYNEQANLDMSVYIIAPVPIPSLWFSKKEESKKYKSSTITKVINQYGILTKTEVEEDGARVATENIAFDKETGEVLITRTTNEFNDYIYNTTFPAHWAYEGMGQAYKNIYFENPSHFVGANGIESNGIMPYQDAKVYFTEGDELIIWPKISDRAYQHVWVTSVNDNSVVLQLRNGNYYQNSNSYVAFKIIRSGRRNMQSTPIGSLVTMTNPLDNFFSTNAYNFDKVVDASAIEFNDRWGVKCNYPEASQDQFNTCFVDSYDDTIEVFNQILNQLSNRDFISSPTIFNLNSNNSSLVNALNKFEYNGQFNGYIKGTISDINNNNSYLLTFNSPKFVNSSANFSNLRLLGYIIQKPITNNNCECNSAKYLVYFKYRETYFSAQLVISAIPNSGYNNIYLYQCRQRNLDPINVGEQNACAFVSGQFSNPYTTGAKGNWRPKRTYTYLTDRLYANETNTRKDGIYKQFSPFWNKPTSTQKFFNTKKDNWTFTQEVVNYDPYGNEVESRDALSNYSAALFGYNNTLSTAVANNSKLKQVAFDGFEDYETTTCGPVRHLDLSNIQNSDIVEDKAHTGKYSLKVNANSNALINVEIKECDDNASLISGNNQEQKCISCEEINKLIASGSYTLKGQINYEYLAKSLNATIGSSFSKNDIKSFTSGCVGYDNTSSLDLAKNNTTAERDKTLCDIPCKCLTGFSPDKGTYVFSVWVSQTNELPNYKGVVATLYSNSSTPQIKTFKPTGYVIDGWQLMQGEFEILNGATNLVISLSANESNTYFDDLRIHPFDSKMKSFVYDNISLKFVAELDENNYATFYEYDEEGHLVRIKKETERGVMTIKESRKGTFKKSL
jgi:hypothetical protein